MGHQKIIARIGREWFCVQHLTIQLLNNQMAHGQLMAKTADSAQQLLCLSIRIGVHRLEVFSFLASLWVANIFTKIKLLSVVITCAKVKCLLPG